MVERSKKTKATKKKMVRGVAGRSMAAGPGTRLIDWTQRFREARTRFGSRREKSRLSERS